MANNKKNKKTTNKKQAVSKSEIVNVTDASMDDDQHEETTTTTTTTTHEEEEDNLPIPEFANLEDINETDFYASIRKVEQFEKLRQKNQKNDKNNNSKKNNKKQSEASWKHVELNDVEVMNCEGLSGFEELSFGQVGDDYDALVQSLISQQKASDFDNDDEGAVHEENTITNDTTDDGDVNMEQTLSKKKKNKKKKKKTAVEATTLSEESSSVASTNEEDTIDGALASSSSAAIEPPSKQSKKRKREEKKKETTEEAETEQVEVQSEQKKDEGSEEPLKPMTEWLDMGIEAGVLQSLQKMKFYTPTPIQKQSIHLAIRQAKDIVAAAETGSGKTLAFGIPILSQLLKKRVILSQHLTAQQQQGEEAVTKKQSYLEALILVPTRELAQQVSKHLREALPPKGDKYTEDLKIVNVFGGMSEAKQNRQLNARPHIIVATPGRFWDFCQRGIDYLTEMHQLKYLVIDEADRMFAQGHFPELLRILEFIDQRRTVHAARTGIESDKIQKFISSATLTLEVEENSHFVKSSTEKSDKSVSALNQLIEMMNMENFEIVNVFKQQEEGASLLAKSLTESQVQCGDEEDKLVHLYYFLLTYPGRTLIFTNTIKKARMIHQLFHGVLGMAKVNILHGEMQQRARLKNLDRFSGTIGLGGDAVLIATDVAARGLDVPDVKHVIHFNMPTQPDVYIHRCGRSGRAHKEGFSLALISPEDKKAYHAVCKKAHNGGDIDQFPTGGHYFTTVPLLRNRIRIAAKIEEKQRKKKRSRTDKDWFKRNAEEMGIDLDNHFFPGVEDSDDEIEPEDDKDLFVLKRDLAKLMKVKIQDRKTKDVISKTFITSTTENFDTLTQSEEKPEDALLEAKLNKQKKEAKATPPASSATTDKKKKNRNKRRKVEKSE